MLIMQRRIILIIDSWHSSHNLEFFISELFPHLLSCLHMNKNLKALARILTQGSCEEERSWKFTCDLMLNSLPCVPFPECQFREVELVGFITRVRKSSPQGSHTFLLWVVFPLHLCLLAGWSISPSMTIQNRMPTGQQSGLAKMNSLCHCSIFFLRKKTASK